MILCAGRFHLGGERMKREEEIEILIDLGLTLLQAKTYLALVSFGTATINTLAKTTGIAKHDVYRIMPKLQVSGLAEKIIAPQATYKAVPVEDTASLLLQHKINENAILQKKTAKLISHYKNNNFDTSVQEEESFFRIISEKFHLLRILDSITGEVKEKISFAHTWEFTKGMLFKHNPDNLVRALKRGVRIRWITETHSEDKQTEEALKVLRDYPLFEIGYFPRPIPLRIAIYDLKYAIMCLSNDSENWMNAMWSNNKMFINAISNSHEQMWHGVALENTEKPPTGA
jgi:sugar-specific transcriptional regulator TrmB